MAKRQHRHYMNEIFITQQNFTNYPQQPLQKDSPWFEHHASLLPIKMTQRDIDVILQFYWKQRKNSKPVSKLTWNRRLLTKGRIILQFLTAWSVLSKQIYLKIIATQYVVLLQNNKKRGIHGWAIAKPCSKHLINPTIDRMVCLWWYVNTLKPGWTGLRPKILASS